jgi:hypothetical protein
MQGEELLRYRGRGVTADDVAFIRELLARHAGASRRQLSKLLCEAWDWRQTNGAPCDMICRGLMLALDRAGHITLPAPRRLPKNNLLQHRRAPTPMLPADASPLVGRLADVEPLEFMQVRRSPREVLFDSLIAQHHYLGYTRPVGEHLKYLVLSRHARPIACLAFSSAPRHVGPRDRFIGWSKEIRRKNIHLIAYNPRFLIPPWVRVRYLASRVLGRMAEILPAEWQRVYGHPIYFLETFVDSGLGYRGTCYRAANWVVLGQTTGRGKADLTHKPNRSIKDVLGYPLTPRFRELLCRIE